MTAVGRLSGVRWGGAAAACVATVAWLLAAPTPALATPTCAYDATADTLTVNLPANFDDPRLTVTGGNIVVTYAFGIPVNCSGSATPPAIDTETIFINGTGAQGNGVFIVGPEDFLNADLEGEVSGAQEVEIFVNLMDGVNSRLRVIADSGGGSFRYGADGINPNATSGEVSPDADIFASQVRTLELLGNAGNDTIGAQGGAGTGNPLTEGISLDGGSGNDSLTGGEGADGLTGGNGSDALFGMAGNDNFRPDADNDSMDGGPGTDSAIYTGVPNPPGISVDLAIAGPQGTGGSGSDSFASIENVFGTSFADTLRGNGGPNRLSGFQGNDFLAGRAGVDMLDGGFDDDALNVRDGGADTADCGPERDTVTADPPGTDTLIECENRVFPAVDPPRDLDPPETTITSGPKKKLKLKKRKKKVTATFGFSSDESDASFECSLDGTPFAACTSPLTEKVKKGLHEFEVRARDRAGNVDQSPASRSFKVKRKRRKRQARAGPRAVSRSAADRSRALLGSERRTGRGDERGRR